MAFSTEMNLIDLSRNAILERYLLSVTESSRSMARRKTLTFFANDPYLLGFIGKQLKTRPHYSTVEVSQWLIDKPALWLAQMARVERRKWNLLSLLGLLKRQQFHGKEDFCQHCLES